MESSLEQDPVKPSSTDERVTQIRSRLASIQAQLPILRPGEFCNSASFLEDLPPTVLDFIEKVSILEPYALRAGSCSQKSEQELMRAVRTSSSIALDSSIALGSVAIKYVQADDPNLGIIISMFGRALNQRWKVGKADKDLDDAIYYFQKTVEFEPAAEANRALHFDDLGCALWERYTKLHDDGDFEASKAAFEAAADLPHSGRPMFLSNLGRLFKDKALAVSEERKALLEKSLNVHIDAITCVTPEFRASIRSLHRGLATTYVELHSIDGGNPLGTLKPLVKEKVQASSKRWMFLYELGVIFKDRFFATGDQESAKKAVALLKSALEDSADNLIVLIALSYTLEQQGVSLRSAEVYAEAYEFSVKAMTLTNEFSPDILDRWASASSTALRGFELSHDPSLVENALTFTRRALASPLLGHGRRWEFQKLLGLELGCKFMVSENMSELDEAVSSLKAVVDTAPESLPGAEKADTLREYGRTLLERFATRKNPVDFDDGIEALTKAVELFSSVQSGVVLAHNDLANAMLKRFEKTGQVGDISKAIDYYLLALAALENFPMIHVERPRSYMGLGNAFFAKYEMWEQAADLNQSIAYYEAAVEASQVSDVRFGQRLASLARAQLQKCRSTHDRKLLTTLQEDLKAFLAKAPPPPPHDISVTQNILGASYLHEYDESENDVSLFDRAAECFQAALDDGSQQPLDINPPLINLTRTVMGKYSKTLNDVDFLKATQQFLKVQTLLKAPSNTELRGLVDTLGQFATLVYDTKNQAQFGRLGAAFYMQLASDKSAFPERRILASLQASRLLYEVNQAPTDARSILVQATRLLPGAILIGPNRADQLRAAKNIASLPSFLVAFSLAAGDSPGDVLQLYETSRSFIWNRLLDMKTDISELREKHEDLANRFDLLRLMLNGASPEIVLTGASATHRVRQLDMNNEYNQLLELIRQKEGFERFLLLEEAYRIPSLASQGPVVVLNATKYRGDAILLTSEGISSIMLPDFVLDSCVENGVRIQMALSFLTNDPQRASLLFDTALKWLWEAAARPVLEELGLTGSTTNVDQKLPRVWWLVSGWLSLLPIHAAGNHARAIETGEPCAVMDRVISSYIPTLRALEFLRHSAKDLSSPEKSHPNTAVLISMPTTPGDHDLLIVTKEVACVKAILQPAFQITALEHPRRQEVMPLLKQASIAHFACHGIADSADPSLSKLKLQDWKKNPLDVRFLLRNSFKRLKFVYLSACETALNKVIQLREESIHPAAAFQMAGVPYAVATMWNIEDNASVGVASDFYSYIAVGTEFDAEKSAEALHFATMQARNQGMDASLWAAFIHAGA